MSFFRQIKPRSTAEWVVLALVAVLVVMTAVLVITRQMLPEGNQDVLLQAMTQSSASETVPAAPSSSAERTETTPVTTGAAETSSLRLDALSQLGGLTRTLSEGGVRSRIALFREAAEERQSEEESQANASELSAVWSAPPVAEEPPAQNTTWHSEESSLSDYQRRMLELSGKSLPETEATQGSVASDPGIPPTTGESTQDVAPAAAPDGNAIAQMQSGVLASMNAARQSAGLPALAWDATLQSIASVRAQELSILYSSGHIRPDGSFSLSSISSTYGAQYGAAENICWGDDLGRLSASKVFNQFFNSPSHHAIMMSGQYSRCAIGIYTLTGPGDVDGTGRAVPAAGRYYVSMNFGT